ncbi:MAG TPA: hypothetical protein PK691_09555, partial [Thermomicrobiales bacterium]|nr:hypothetical protein [Thermomicrobiales bacterium]
VVPVVPVMEQQFADLPAAAIHEPAADEPMSFAELDNPVAFGAEASVPSAEEDFVFEEAVSYTALLDLPETEIPTEPEGSVEAAAEPAWAGRQGLGPVARKVLWPPFVNQTSNLIDREDEGDRLFARIAQQKQALMEMGVIAVERRLQPQSMPVAVEAEAVENTTNDDPVIREVLPTPEPAAPLMSEQTRIDLMAMRARLTDDDEAAGEIADTIERAMSEGLKAPLAQRVLGEAYLKLGQVERAAAQFRQAMLARRRS